jgi:hypothetical protein
MGSLTKTITLDVPSEVIYEVIKFTNIDEEWNSSLGKYLRDLFDYKTKYQIKILQDEKNKRFAIRIELKDYYEEYYFSIKKNSKNKVDLTITHKHEYEIENIDKALMYSDISSFLLFDLGYQKGRERGLRENIFI